jgi:acyl carrier protein
MNNDNISIESLIEALSSDFDNLKTESVETDNSLESLLEWSSLNSLLITVRIKQNFGVELLPGELRASETFKQLLSLINSKRSGN